MEWCQKRNGYNLPGSKSFMAASTVNYHLQQGVGKGLSGPALPTCACITARLCPHGVFFKWFQEMGLWTLQEVIPQHSRSQS